MKKNIFLFTALLIGGLSLSIVPHTDYASVLAEDEVTTITLGEKVAVESRRLVYGGQSKTVSGVIMTPSDKTYSGREFTAKEHGQYKVIYEALFGSHKVTKSVTYLCQRKSSDYFTVDGGTTISYGDFRYNTKKYSHSGVIFDVKNGSTITFNEPIDMNDFMVEQPTNPEPGKTFRDPTDSPVAKSLIDFLVDPSQQYQADFTGLLFTFTDVDDPLNYFEIRLQDTSGDAGTLSYARVGASGGFLAGWEFSWSNETTVNIGHFHYSESGTGIAMSFRGQPYQDQIHSGNFLLDYNNLRLYTYPGSHSHSQVFFMNDLDDEDVYKNNAWAGFKNRKCKLTITPYSFNTASGRLIIKSVGKIALNNEVLVDDVAPTINVDYQGYSKSSLPKAVVGQRYPLFEASVNDNYDNNLSHNVSVTYHDAINNQEIDVSVKNNGFLPAKSGVYTITYSAKDRSGNKANDIVYKVSTIDAADNVSLALASTSNTVPVYSKATIPSINDVVTSGGVENGKINVTRTIIDPDNEELVITGDSFVPEKMGNYKIYYDGVDYIGNTGQVVYTLTVTGLDKPAFLSEPNLPPVLIKGFTYSFDSLTAVETIGQQIKSIDTEIKVNGQPYQNSVVADGTSMTVSYVATGESGNNTLSTNIPVVDVSDPDHQINQAKYFYGGTAIENEDDVTLSFDNDASYTFANKLDANDFYILFGKEAGDVAFSKMQVILTDVADNQSSVTFDIDLAKGKLSCAGFEEVDFSILNNEFAISFTNLGGAIKDLQNKSCGYCSFDDQNNPFTGFYKGVYLTISFVNVTGPVNLKVEKINNQSIGYKDGTGDRMEPVINLNGRFATEQRFGATFEYPTFEAFDVLNEIETTSIRIVKPNGSPISGDHHFSDSFTIEEYGDFTVVYQAKDTSYNSISLTKHAFVYDDIAPTLTVDKLAKDTYKVGAAVKIPAYHASDNLEGLSVDVILILPTNEMRILTHDENGVITYALIDTAIYNSSFIKDKKSFKTEIKGKHILRYVAYDAQFNTTIVELTFEVK